MVCVCQTSIIVNNEQVQLLMWMIMIREDDRLWY